MDVSSPYLYIFCIVYSSDDRLDGKYSRCFFILWEFGVCRLIFPFIFSNISSSFILAFSIFLFHSKSLFQIFTRETHFPFPTSRWLLTWVYLSFLSFCARWLLFFFCFLLISSNFLSFLSLTFFRSSPLSSLFSPFLLPFIPSSFFSFSNPLFHSSLVFARPPRLRQTDFLYPKN